MQKILTVLFAFAFFVLVVGLHSDSYACHKKPKPHGGDTSCDPIDESVKDFPVQVTFRDDGGDTIKSDGEGAYTRAIMPVEFAPPGQFLMVTNPDTRGLIINFGTRVGGDCKFATGCVEDANSNRVECPFPDDGGEDCAQLVRGTLLARDVFEVGTLPEDNPNKVEFILDMGLNTIKEVQALEPYSEISFNVSPSVPFGKEWIIRFGRDDCSDLGSLHAKFLRIEAFDDAPEVGGKLGADRWDIGTFSDSDGSPGMRLGCLLKPGKGQKVEPVGIFEMAFEYEICILGSGSECPVFP